MLVSTVVSRAWVALGVLVAHGRSQSIEDGAGGDVLRGNEEDRLALALDFFPLYRTLDWDREMYTMFVTMISAISGSSWVSGASMSLKRVSMMFTALRRATDVLMRLRQCICLLLGAIAAIDAIGMAVHTIRSHICCLVWWKVGWWGEWCLMENAREDFEAKKMREELRRCWVKIQELSSGIVSVKRGNSGTDV